MKKPGSVAALCAITAVSAGCGCWLVAYRPGAVSVALYALFLAGAAYNWSQALATRESLKAAERALKASERTEANPTGREERS